MDYPYIRIVAQSADQENDIKIDLTVGGTLPVDEGDLVDVIKDHLVGLSGVASASATKYSVSQQVL